MPYSTHSTHDAHGTHDLTTTLPQTFYIITEGVATALRTEAGSADERELGTLGEGAFFGERALIKNQVKMWDVGCKMARAPSLASGR